MPSAPLGSTGGRTTSVFTCHLLTLIAHTVGGCRAWHAIIALGQLTRSNYIRRGMPSWPLDYTHDRAWHSIIDLGQQTHDRITSGVASNIALQKHRTSKDVWQGMLSSPLECTHDQMMLGVSTLSSSLGSTHHRMTLMCHPIIAFGLHAQTNDVARGMPSSPLCSTHSRMPFTLGQHTPSSLLDSIHGRMTSRQARYYLPWIAHTFGNAIIGLGKHRQ